MIKPGTVAHACNSRYSGVNCLGLGILVQPEQNSKIPSTGGRGEEEGGRGGEGEEEYQQQHARCQWLTPVIPDTQEAEIRRITIQSQPRETASETLS
jgi:hypothetical protein